VRRENGARSAERGRVCLPWTMAMSDIEPETRDAESNDPRDRDPEDRDPEAVILRAVILSELDHE